MRGAAAARRPSKGRKSTAPRCGRRSQGDEAPSRRRPQRQERGVPLPTPACRLQQLFPGAVRAAHPSSHLGASCGHTVSPTHVACTRGDPHARRAAAPTGSQPRSLAGLWRCEFNGPHRRRARITVSGQRCTTAECMLFPKTDASSPFSGIAHFYLRMLAAHMTEIPWCLYFCHKRER